MSATAASETPGKALHGSEVRTLREAAREFARKPSPWLIALAIAAGVGARAALGDLSWRDGVAVAAILAIYPFGEWAIHVYVLHMRPFELRGWRIDPPAARGHRAHHRDPHDLGMIALEPAELAQLLFLAVPFTIALVAVPVSLLGGPVSPGAMVSAALAGYAAIGVYEWTHFLIHTAYRPRSRYYRSIRRNHRLHHFKHEGYWHGITNTIGDRVLGTDPDQRSVPRSRAARDLDLRLRAGPRS
jgi:Fatty acid hydroxylase